MTRRERKLSGVLVFTALGAVIFLFIITDHIVEAPGGTPLQKAVASIQQVLDPNVDIGPQIPLASLPPVVKAIYATNWSAGSSKKMNYLLDLLNTTELNAIVIDIKDYTGVVAWPMRIPKINTLIKKLHDNNIYVIGRIAVFQDSVLVKLRPDLALASKATGGVWGDRKNAHWLDTASQEVWDYNIALAQDALARGFDEINFDYIRFASDGDISDIQYPFYDRLTPKQAVLNKFFAYLRAHLPDAKLSADLFGEATYTDDSGIGQRLSDAFPNFDAIAPMVYPSHYAPGFRGHANPATAPYDVVHYSLESAIAKAQLFDQTAPTSTVRLATFRPWLQDFDLGADYGAMQVRAQIQALDDLSASSSLITGWMLWNPSNVYTKEALLPN